MAQLVERSKGLWPTPIPLLSACPRALQQNIEVVADTIFDVMSRLCTWRSFL